MFLSFCSICFVGKSYCRREKTFLRIGVEFNVFFFGNHQRQKASFTRGQFHGGRNLTENSNNEIMELWKSEASVRDLTSCFEVKAAA